MSPWPISRLRRHQCVHPPTAPRGVSPDQVWTDRRCQKPPPGHEETILALFPPALPRSQPSPRDAATPKGRAPRTQQPSPKRVQRPPGPCRRAQSASPPPMRFPNHGTPRGSLVDRARYRRSAGANASAHSRRTTLIPWTATLPAPAHSFPRWPGRACHSAGCGARRWLRRRPR